MSSNCFPGGKRRQERIEIPKHIVSLDQPTQNPKARKATVLPLARGRDWLWRLPAGVCAPEYILPGDPFDGLFRHSPFVDRSDFDPGWGFSHYQSPQGLQDNCPQWRDDTDSKLSRRQESGGDNQGQVSNNPPNWCSPSCFLLLEKQYWSSLSRSPEATRADISQGAILYHDIRFLMKRDNETCLLAAHYINHMGKHLPQWGHSDA